jgi:hypothetical protein
MEDYPYILIRPNPQAKRERKTQCQEGRTATAAEELWEKRIIPYGTKPARTTDEEEVELP